MSQKNKMHKKTTSIPRHIIIANLCILIWVLYSTPQLMLQPYQKDMGYRI